MKKLNLKQKYVSMLVLMAFGVFFSCQVEEEEVSERTLVAEEEVVDMNDGLTLKKGEEINCTTAGTNSVRETDISNPNNDGNIDDRSCYANYYETNEGGRTYGNYNIAYGSNHIDSNGLQPRIERSVTRSNSNVGSYVKLTGVVRILEVGNTSNTNNDGTYIAQAKGKHTGGGGSNDPAICLFLAKPVYGYDNQGRWTQTSFNIYREQINYRGGEGSSGRTLVFLKNIQKGHPTAFELKVGFRNDNGQKKHYANAKIGGTNFYWNIPEPEKGTQSGIRYGAYRVKGGIARIQWSDTVYTTVNN